MQAEDCAKQTRCVTAGCWEVDFEAEARPLSLSPGSKSAWRGRRFAIIARIFV